MMYVQAGGGRDMSPSEAHGGIFPMQPMQLMQGAGYDTGMGAGMMAGMMQQQLGHQQHMQHMQHPQHPQQVGCMDGWMGTSHWG